MAASPNHAGSQLVAEVETLLRQRYGRDGDIANDRGNVSLQAAGYATSGGWWSLQAGLAESTTSFLTLDVSIRLNLLFAELLMYPGDQPSRIWAQRYGYASPSSASRAFRDRFDVGIGDTRRMGLVGLWLASARRTPQNARGVARQREAQRRLDAFRHAVRAPDQSDTLATLGHVIPDVPPTARPRYPPIGRVERARLSSGSGE